MDNNAQPSPKQQLIEAVRSANSVVITTSKSPDRDQIAAAIGLHLMLESLDKVAEVVLSTSVPKALDFLPSDFINKKLQGQRDFVIELDQSRTEGDHLKYVIEGSKLKIFITPYNGVYSKDDVSFSYGDYHCDVVIGLGSHDIHQLDPAVTKDHKLAEHAKFVFITSGAGGTDSLNWSDASASSVCEMVMSMSEALGSGIVNKEIATALFTGIVDKTEHFTNSATTPKVMTMAAQLLAAGANQTEVVKRLSAPQVAEPEPDKAKPAPSHSSGKSSHDGHTKSGDTESKTDKPDPPNEFQLRSKKPQHKPEEEKGSPSSPADDNDPHLQDSVSSAPANRPDLPAPPSDNREASTPSTPDAVTVNESVEMPHGGGVSQGKPDRDAPSSPAPSPYYMPGDPRASAPNTTAQPPLEHNPANPQATPPPSSPPPPVTPSPSPPPPVSSPAQPSMSSPGPQQSTPDNPGPAVPPSDSKPENSKDKDIEAARKAVEDAMRSVQTANQPSPPPPQPPSSPPPPPPQS